MAVLFGLVVASTAAAQTDAGQRVIGELRAWHDSHHAFFMKLHGR